jgi:hypothetical protein
VRKTKSTTAPYEARDDLTGVEARDRTERSLAEVARGPEEKLGRRPLVSSSALACQWQAITMNTSQGPRASVN